MFYADLQRISQQRVHQWLSAWKLFDQQHLTVHLPPDLQDGKRKKPTKLIMYMTHDQRILKGKINTSKTSHALWLTVISMFNKASGNMHEDLILFEHLNHLTYKCSTTCTCTCTCMFHLQVVQGGSESLRALT